MNRRQILLTLSAVLTFCLVGEIVAGSSVIISPSSESTHEIEIVDQRETTLATESREEQRKLTRRTIDRPQVNFQIGHSSTRDSQRAKTNLHIWHCNHRI